MPAVNAKDIKITKEIIEQEGLTMEEYGRIKKLIGREPNYTELGLFSAMWSETVPIKIPNRY